MLWGAKIRTVITSIGLIAASLVLAANNEAKIDLETAMGIWLLDENKGKVAKDVSGNDNHGEIQGDQMDLR